jgi:type III secretion system FlhB-like substrate exporter
LTTLDLRGLGSIVTDMGFTCACPTTIASEELRVLHLFHAIIKSLLRLVLGAEILVAVHQITAEVQLFIQDNAPSTKGIVQIKLITFQLVVIQATAVATQLVAYERKNTFTLARITRVNVKRDTFLIHRYIGHGTIKTLMTKLEEIGKVIQELLEDLAAHIARDVYSRLAQVMAHLIVRRTVVVSRVAHIQHGRF